MISRILALIVAAALISGCDPTSAAGICDVDRGFDEVPWLVGDSGVATPIRCPGEHPAPGRGRVAIVDEPETGWVVCGCYHDADEDGQHDQGEAVAPADTLFSYERQSVRYDLILNSCADLEQQCDRRYIGGAATTVKPYAVQPLLGVNPAGPFVAASSCQVVPLFDLVQKAACSLEVMREATVPRGRCDSGANRALRCLQKYPRVYFGNSDPRAPCRALADDLGGWRLGTLELADDCVNEAEWIAQVTTADSGVWANVVQCVDDGVRGGLEFERSNPDHDRVCSDIDNCDDDPNDDQVDCDNDGRGNLCDDDRDGDGVPDVTEEDCGTLHRCASDFDGDNLEDLIETLGGEKCPDSDNDGTNDVVDKDSDNDGLDDGDEAVGTCANGLDPYRVADCDGDGVLDPSDNCPLDANPTDANNSQVDLDEDGKGDVCDDDRDGDGDDNADDNCPDDANPDQADPDGDGVGDACEPVIVIQQPHGDPEVPGIEGNTEFTFTARQPAVLRIVAMAQVENFDPGRMVVEFSMATRGDLTIDWRSELATAEDVAHMTGDGQSAVPDADGIVVVPGQPRVVQVWRVGIAHGLPRQFFAFGAHSVVAEVKILGRPGPVALAHPQKVEIFWPYLVDGASGTGPWRDEDFARNHPDPHGPGYQQIDVQHGCPRSGEYQFASAVPPNWFYYWSQLPIVEDRGMGAEDVNRRYHQNATFKYVVEDCDGQCGAPAYGHSNIDCNPAAGLDVPIGVAYLNQKNGRECGDGEDRCNGEPNCCATERVIWLHTTMYHEYLHMVREIRWSQTGLGLAPDAVDFTTPFNDQQFWSTTYRRSPIVIGPRLGNHFRDIIPDPGRVPPWETYADCDYDGDGVISQAPSDYVLEAEVQQRCTGVPPPDDVDPVGFGEVRINYDDTVVDRLYESAPETQDWDEDNVPDWEDEDVRPNSDSDHAQIDRRVGAFRAEAGLGTAIQELDWSDTGVNHASE